MADKSWAENSDEVKGLFDKLASEYETQMGPTTGAVAAAGLKYLPPATSSTHYLDSASGPGIVTKLILDTAKEHATIVPRITAIDVAPGMIQQVKANKALHEWDTVDAEVMNAQKLDAFADATFDAVFMNLGIFALPDPMEGTKEIVRVLKPGGVAILTTWKLSSPVAVLEEVTAAIRPDCVGRVFPVSKDWETDTKLRDVLVSGGFAASKVQVVPVESVWESETPESFVEAMCAPFWARIWQGWTDEEMAQWKPEVRKKIKLNAKGGVTLPMIAWMGIATK